MRYSNEFLNKKYEVLPKNIKYMMGSSNITDAIKVITDKHKLHIDKAGILSDEITYVMVGAEKSSDFIRNLKAQLHFPDEKINAIAKDVNEKIFLQIREIMKKAQDSPTDTVDKSQEKKEIHHVQSNLPKTGIDKQANSNLHEVHNVDLEAKPIKKESTVDMVKESEDIKQEVAKQQNVKPVVPLPSNLPTSEPVADQQQNQNLKAQPSDGEGEDKLQNNNKNNPSPVLEKNKPYSTDPYREPIEE